MKYLINLNTTSIIDTWQLDSSTFKLPPPYDKYKASFIPHCLALFASIPLEYNDKSLVSMSKTIAKIKAREIHIVPNVGEFTSAKIIDLLYIFRWVNRGKLIVGSQAKNPEYGALTPIFMYAHKKYNNIKYSKWDRNDTMINAALGLFLAKASDQAKLVPHLPLSMIPTLRQSLCEGKKYTDWNTYLKYTSTQDPVDGNEYGEDIHYEKETLIMQLQLWIANASIRNTDAMLLDMYTFGMVPKAIDAIIKSDPMARDM